MHFIKHRNDSLIITVDLKLSGMGNPSFGNRGIYSMLILRAYGHSVSTLLYCRRRQKISIALHIRIQDLVKLKEDIGMGCTVGCSICRYHMVNAFIIYIEYFHELSIKSSKMCSIKVIKAFIDEKQPSTTLSSPMGTIELP